MVPVGTGEQQARFKAARSGTSISRVIRRHPSDCSAMHGHQRTSAPTGSSQGRGSAPRQTSYALRKERRIDLEKQVLELEEQVDRLRLKAGLPIRADREAITATSVSNTTLDKDIHANRQYFVQLQSQVMNELQSPLVNPLSTFIHLPRDREQRGEILRQMKDVKLRRAARHGIERFRHLEENLSYMSEERFPTADGVYHCNRWEMNTFPNFQSARQLYDALLFFVYNIEIGMTDMVDQIAVREDSEDIEPTIWNHRIVTQAQDVGCTEELNYVGFAQFYNSYDLLDNAPLGVFAFDTVDLDDLYPYVPLERTRKDVQAYHLVSEVLDPGTQRTAVTLKSFFLNAQLRAQFPLESDVVEKLHENMSSWYVAIVRYLREYVVCAGS